MARKKTKKTVLTFNATSDVVEMLELMEEEAAQNHIKTNRSRQICACIREHANSRFLQEKNAAQKNFCEAKERYQATLPPGMVIRVLEEYPGEFEHGIAVKFPQTRQTYLTNTRRRVLEHLSEKIAKKSYYEIRNTKQLTLIFVKAQQLYPAFFSDQEVMMQTSLDELANEKNKEKSKQKAKKIIETMETNIEKDLTERYDTEEKNGR